MKQRLATSRDIENRITVVPPWSHDDVSFNSPGREEFREANRLGGKFVVMYSGNHSPCHPLDTVLGAAKTLAFDERIQFVFVGGGSQFPVVENFAIREKLTNVTCLPYQPKERLSGSLSAADLHLVVMGDQFVGIVHPCKIYNVLSIGSPFVYIGPNPSHVSDLVEELGDSARCLGSFRHGEVSELVARILTVAGRQRGGVGPLSDDRYSSSHLISQLVSKIETLKTRPAVTQAVADTPY